MPCIANEPAIANRLMLAQSAVKRQRRTEPVKFERKGEIDLITVAFKNQPFYPVDRGSVGFCVDARLQTANASTPTPYPLPAM